MTDRSAPWRGLAAAGEQVLARAIAWPVLRLSLGRWPTRAEARRFRQAFCDRPAQLPALLRGLGSVPTVRNHFLDLLDPPPRMVPPMAFLHLEKAAGTSVVEFLAAQFPPEAVDPDPFHGMPGHLFCPSPDDKRRYAFVWGHQDLPAFLRCQPPRRFVLTFLREPRQRIVSLYRYWRALSPEEIALGEQHAGVVAARTRSFRDFLDSPEPEVADFVDNLAARRLTGSYASHLRPGQAPAPDAHLEAAAMSALDSLDFVGIVEQMGASLARLAALTGSHAPQILPRQNVLATMQLEIAAVYGKAPRLRPGAAEAARLDHLTRIDRKLYAAALERLRRTALR